MTRHRLPGLVSVWLLATACLPAGPGRAAEVIDLDRAGASHLPWKTELKQYGNLHQVLDGGWIDPVLVARRGDEILNFTARNPGIVMDRIVGDRVAQAWQHNLPPSHCGRSPCAGLNGLWDADGDGEPELVLTSPADDRSSWLVQALALADGHRVAEVRVGAGPDLRQDGGWDGNYAAVGVADVPGPAGPRRAFLVMAEAGFDLEPRGVMAIDVGTGERIWEHFTGAKPPPFGTACADLDGDGQPEVVFIGAAVDNLGGRQVGGLSDDVCTVVAVDTDGSRLWTRTFPRSVSGFLQVAAADSAGGALVCVALSGRWSDESTLQVLDGPTGRTLAEADLTGGPRGLQAAAAARGLDLYVGVTDLGLVHYRYDGRLDRLAVATSGDRPFVYALADLLPPPGLEVLAASQSGTVHILDRDLEPLAEYIDDQHRGFPKGLVPMYSPWGEPAILVQGDPETPGAWFALAANPRPIPWGALSLLPIAGGATWYVRRRRRGTSAATRRELRLQLLGRLELSGHGAIGALRSLRRLVWLLDARSQAAEGSPDLDARLAALLDECRGHMLPDLAGTLELAGLAGCDATVTGQARAAHERLARLLDDGPDPGRDERLRETATLLENAMMSLRREIEDDFRADLAAVVARVLAAHAEAAATAGVTVATDGLDAPLWCRGDPDELVFVVDNLVENALRAMAASPRRELMVRVRRDDTRILLQVQDTGCGIAPDDWEAVLETRMSTREGGGLGLPESRRRLRKHGGSLAVTASTAGAGTTLTLSVAPARAQESV